MPAGYVRDQLHVKYVGQSVDALIMQYGAPTAVAPLSDGGKHYTFTKGYMEEHYKRGSVPVSCKVLAVVDKAGKVTRMGTTDPENQYGGSYCSRVLGIKPG